MIQVCYHLAHIPHPTVQLLSPFLKGLSHDLVLSNPEMGVSLDNKQMLPGGHMKHLTSSPLAEVVHRSEIYQRMS